MFKKIPKVMLCLTVCLSMFLPFVRPVYASEGFDIPQPYSDGTDPSLYPYYYINFYTFNAGSSTEYSAYDFVYSKDKLLFTSQKNFDFDYDKYIKDGLILRRQFCIYKSDGRTEWKTVKTWVGTLLSYTLSSNYDLMDDDGNVLFKGDTSDNPPSPDVPTGTSLWEILRNVFLPMILVVIGGMASWMLFCRLLRLLRRLLNQYLKG